MRLRNTAGQLCEVELHGHLPQSALHPADQVQLTLRPQRDPELPPRIERIVNLTTGQLLHPAYRDALVAPRAAAAVAGVPGRAAAGRLAACSALT